MGASFEHNTHHIGNPDLPLGTVEYKYPCLNVIMGRVTAETHCVVALWRREKWSGIIAHAAQHEAT